MSKTLNFLGVLYIISTACSIFILTREGDLSTNEHVSKRTDGPVQW